MTVVSVTAAPHIGQQDCPELCRTVHVLRARSLMHTKARVGAVVFTFLLFLQHSLLKVKVTAVKPNSAEPFEILKQKATTTDGQEERQEPSLPHQLYRRTQVSGSR